MTGSYFSSFPSFWAFVSAHWPGLLLPAFVAGARFGAWMQVRQFQKDMRAMRAAEELGPPGGYVEPIQTRANGNSTLPPGTA